MMIDIKPKICSICQREFSPLICFEQYVMEHGNNAQPVNDGRCCDKCNQNIVVPARINALNRRLVEESL
jgi:hypothetical protein